MQWKSASARVEARTSGFLSISDIKLRVSAELEQGSLNSSFVEAWNSACLSSCSWGVRTLVELYLKPVDFLEDATGVSVPLHVVTSSLGLHSKRGPGIRTYLRGRRSWCLSECGTIHEACSRVSMRDRPPPEVRREGRDSVPDKAAESTLMLTSGGENGLRIISAGKLGVPLE